jgi:ribonuclease P protein component
MVLEPDLSKHRQISELTSKRVPTLKKRSEFLRLKAGKRYSAKSFILETKASETHRKTEYSRVGYTVTKKVGNAVVRNRIRRRLREAVSKTFAEKSLPTHDYVLIGKYGALTQNFASILKDLEQALDHVHRNGAKGSRKLN